MNTFNLKYITDQDINTVIEKLKDKVNESGFKVLNELSLSDKISKTLNIDFDDYHILEVCNPKFAQEIITQEKSAGLFLPCKIAVYTDGESTKVELQKPTFMSAYFYSKHIE